MALAVWMIGSRFSDVESAGTRASSSAGRHTGTSTSNQTALRIGMAHKF
ncbi:hypothetical protein PQQ52_26295 [Paraburkholderia sediminicola]